MTNSKGHKKETAQNKMGTLLFRFNNNTPAVPSKMKLHHIYITTHKHQITNFSSPPNQLKQWKFYKKNPII